MQNEPRERWLKVIQVASHENGRAIVNVPSVGFDPSLDRGRSAPLSLTVLAVDLRDAAPEITPAGFLRGDAPYVHGPLAASQIGEKRVEYHPPLGYHEAVLGVARSLLAGERTQIGSAASIVGLAQEIVDRALALDPPTARAQEPTP